MALYPSEKLGGGTVGKFTVNMGGTVRYNILLKKGDIVEFSIRVEGANYSTMSGSTMKTLFTIPDGFLPDASWVNSTYTDTSSIQGSILITNAYMIETNNNQILNPWILFFEDGKVKSANNTYIKDLSISGCYIAK